MIVFHSDDARRSGIEHLQELGGDVVLRTDPDRAPSGQKLDRVITLATVQFLDELRPLGFKPMIISSLMARCGIRRRALTLTASRAVTGFVSTLATLVANHGLSNEHAVRIGRRGRGSQTTPLDICGW